MAAPSFQPPPPPPKIDPRQLRPSRAWYWVGGAIGVLSVIAAGGLFFSILRPLFDDVEKLSTGRPASVRLDEGDERSIYVQTDGEPAPGARLGSTGTDVACTVTGPDGRRVEVSRSNGFTLTKNDDAYHAELDFTPTASGEQNVSCVGNVPGERIALAVGPHFGAVGFAVRLFGFFAALFGGPLIGGLIVLVVALMRVRSKKRLQAAAAGAPGGGAPPPPFMDASR